MIFIQRSCLLLFLYLIQLTSCIKNPKKSPLNQWPMIMAHDAATTYLKGGILHQVNDWTKTQPSGGIKALLECGARAFDWRPRLKDDKLIMHHGPISIEHKMSDSLDELLKWSLQNQGLPGFVILSIVDCDGGDACVNATKQLLASKGINYINQCDELNDMNAWKAYQQGIVRNNGGSVLAIFGCKDDHYDPNVTCSGYLETKEAFYTCYNTSSSRSLPFSKLWDYANKVISLGPRRGRIYTLQMLWQESPESVAIGELHGSSLIGDEEYSNINRLVAAKVLNGQLNCNRLNLIEVNNVCDSGKELLHALQLKCIDTGLIS